MKRVKLSITISGTPENVDSLIETIRSAWANAPVSGAFVNDASLKVEA